MAKQPEGKLSLKIMNAWRDMGAFCYKVHGSEFQPSGLPDISGVYRGYSVQCETKMPGNKPSMIQYRMHNKMRRAGALVVVSYSVEEAVQMLEHIRSNEHTRDMCDCLYVQQVDLRALVYGTD